MARSKKGWVYKPLKPPKAKVPDEIKTTLEMRLKTIDSKVQRTKGQIESLRKSIQSDLQNKGA